MAGNDRDAAHVGDFPNRDQAIGACRAYGRKDGPFWIEPVDFNGDPEHPVYRNAGPIEEVEREREPETLAVVVGTFVGQGNQLRARLLSMQESELDSAKFLVNAWVDATYTLLKNRAPEYADFFVSHAGQTAKVYGKGVLDPEICFLEDRLERLNDILMRLA